MNYDYKNCTLWSSYPWVLESRYCFECKIIYNPVVPNQKYCSRKCGKRVYGRTRKEQPEYKKCLNCGHDFLVKNKKQEFCSRRCFVRSNYRANKNQLVSRSHSKSNARIRNAQIISEQKAKGCADCYDSDPCCLEFHHVDPTTKKGEIARMARDGVGEEKLRREISRCIVVCSNCHRKREHYKIGVIRTEIEVRPNVLRTQRAYTRTSGRTEDKELGAVLPCGRKDQRQL